MRKLITIAFILLVPFVVFGQDRVINYDFEGVDYGENKVEVTVTSEDSFGNVEQGWSVRYGFEVKGGEATIGAEDTQGTYFKYNFPEENEGCWGPKQGFEIPAGFNATTTWDINLKERTDYKIDIYLLAYKDGEFDHEIENTRKTFSYDFTPEPKPEPRESRRQPQQKVAWHNNPLNAEKVEEYNRTIRETRQILTLMQIRVNQLIKQLR